MSEEILSIAFIEPIIGRETECQSQLKQVGEIIARKQYGRDVLYRDSQDPHLLVLTRYWHDAETRRHAHEDPEMHRVWRELSEVCRVTKVYEQLNEV